MFFHPNFTPDIFKQKKFFKVLEKHWEFEKKINMKKINFAKAITENDVRKENFIYSFLSSIRQKMEVKKK